MTQNSAIYDKLELFGKRYYTKLLMKGVLLFLFFGLLFLFLVLGVEYFLWLGHFGRRVLFWSLVCLEGFLLYQYIIVPTLFLFKIKKGISHKEAAHIIGKHFVGVDDRLLNFLELTEKEKNTELLLASIEQKVVQLAPYDFRLAINFKDNLKYLKLLVVPALILLVLLLSGQLKDFFRSYDRVVKYNVAYAAPAPFSFDLINQNLSVLENESLKVMLTTSGNLKPAEMVLEYNSQQFLMNHNSGTFTYEIKPPVAPGYIRFNAAGISSREYVVQVLKVPKMLDFSMELQYPDYIKKSNDIIKGTGNASIPEGTNVKWNVNTSHLTELLLRERDTVYTFQKNNNRFSFDKRIMNDLSYKIISSNENINEYETLAYNFEIIKDVPPRLTTEQVLDSTYIDRRQISGVASDDYGLSLIKLVCRSANSENDIQEIVFSNKGLRLEEFHYTFPSGLDLKEGVSYEYYIEAWDNDGVNGPKATKGITYAYNHLTNNEIEERRLNQQYELIKDFQEIQTLEEKQTELLNDIQNKQKQRDELGYNDKRDINNFLRRQEQQSAMLERFSKELNKSMENRENNPLNEILKERLERQEIEAKKNQKLLEELQKITDQIKKEELTKKLEEIAKGQTNNHKNLEQLLELTKRYYVGEKARQLAMKLDALSKEQKALQDLENGLNRQAELNKRFKDLEDDLDDLMKNNENLQKPMPFEDSNTLREQISEDQTKALKELDKQTHEKLTDAQKSKSVKQQRQSQQSASEKMKQISSGLQNASSMEAGETLAEDAEMLRQILDNLVLFSFKQESLFDKVSEVNVEQGNVSQFILAQNELKELFGHVDDSLWVLSMRQPEIGETVTEQITEVFFNIDAALTSLADSRVYQGAASQQYALTASNTLADILASILDNMQQSLMSGSGEGQSGQGFQLPDIIKSQQQLGQQMGQSGSKDSGEGNQGEHGNEGKEGNEGQTGEGGKEGKEKSASGSENDNERMQRGNSQNEQMSPGELYSIYQQQQKIRKHLEFQLKNMIRASDKELGKSILKEMDEFSNDILNNGVNNSTRERLNRIQQQLMILESAELTQGKKQERNSTSSTIDFSNPILTPPLDSTKSQEELELLQRDPLPLRRHYTEKVQSYFSNDN